MSSFRRTHKVCRYQGSETGPDARRLSFNKYILLANAGKSRKSCRKGLAMRDARDLERAKKKKGAISWKSDKEQ